MVYKMPSINEVIERVGRVKPNAVDQREQANWLMELDGQLYEELTKADTPDRVPPREWPEDGDKPLLIPSPYDRVYDLYVTAMIEFYLREYGNYNNTVSLFNEMMRTFRSRYRQSHLPDRSILKNVF